MQNETSSLDANDGNKKKSSQKKEFGFDSVRNLSPTMLGRYHAFQPRYKTQTLSLLKSIKLRGKDGIESVSDKSDTANSSTGNDLKYNRSVTEGFKIGVEYDGGQVSAIICSSRSVSELTRLKGKIIPQCIAELGKLFIVESYLKMGPNGKRERYYKPIFALLVI
ncbi:hypothetical protein ABIB62_003004 [Mucilaginibacter sp. UYP25]|uniref:hypothetical protein n=1 Tax=unclassified Mucilaginibacter TaxID=2617802 RepID=UPI003393DBBE